MRKDGRESMREKIRIGSRESKLAVIQAEIVKSKIQQTYPGITVEIITMKTTGDKILNQNLDAIGGKGLFVKELDQALRDGKIDLAVHSLKDMPMEVPKDLPILAFTKREDPRDVLIYRPGRTDLPCNAVIGSSSKRRTIQMKRMYPECSFRGIRGNVQTRLRKLTEEGYDGTILAAAGLIRLGMESCIGRIFEIHEMVPAAGQGILAVQGRAGEDDSFLECVKDRDSTYAAKSERAFVAALNGGCSSPVAAYARVKGNEIHLTGLLDQGCKTDMDYQVQTITGEISEARKLGEQLAMRLAASSKADY